YLNEFDTEVIQNENKYRVIYSYGNFSGVCEYELYRSGKRIKQDVLLLIKVEMGDVIEKIHMDSPLTSDDLTDMSMSIRTHSLKKVEDFIDSGGHHQ
ncbi:MAG: hypothetical protein EBU66_19940, partial [Bacteroidetes bacterium]|nr:hypothetical protein [Bacteroidota bacterium]